MEQVDIYKYRKIIQKLYNNSVYGEIKGDIYNELCDLRIDNKFIERVSVENDRRTVYFELNEMNSDNILSLQSQIKNVIELFVDKNYNVDSEMHDFLEAGDGYSFDSYIINNCLFVQL